MSAVFVSKTSVPRPPMGWLPRKPTIVDDAIRSNLLLKHPTIYNISPLLESYMVKGPASHQMCNTEDLDSTNFLRWRYDSE